MATPPVKRFMTAFPTVTQAGESIASARAVMEDKGIRHLPVLDESTLIGVVSERDLRVVETAAANESSLTIADVCTRAPLCVDLETPFDEVVDSMQKLRVGSALVLREGKLAGIVTMTDVSRLLVRHLRERYPDDDVVA